MSDQTLLINGTEVVVVDSTTVELLEIAVQGPPGPQGVPGPASGDGVTAPAGEAIGGHRGVVTDAAGLAWYADNTNPSHLGRFAGVTLGAVAAGGTASIVRAGNITEPTWNWTAHAPVFLSTNGLLTQTLPLTGYLQVVGIALSPTVLFVNPREPLATL